MKAQYAKITVQVLLVSLLALLLVGCGESGSPGGGTGPGETASIALTSGSATLPADGFSSTSITASLTDSVGQSVDQNTELTFHTNLGHFRNGEQVYKVDTVDDSGTFIAQLSTGTTAGTAEIIVTSNSITQKLEIELIKSLPPVTIDLSIAPSTLNPNGTTSVTAMVKNVNDEPAADETIIFSVQSSDSGGEFQTLTATTNVNGEAEVNYIAGSGSGEDLLKATAETNGVSGSATLIVDPDATVVDNITVVAGAGSILADGITEVAIRATVTDIDGNPASGKIVNFQTTAGTLTTTSSTTNANGMAEVSLRSSTTTGTATVRAEADGFFSEVDVAFVSGAAQSILVYASPETVNPGDSFQISAAPLDANNNRLNNERLTFSVREVGSSEILDTAEQVTDEQGIVRIDLAAVYGTSDLEITVETSNGTSNSVVVEVDEEATVVGSISLDAGASAVVANGKSLTKIRATVLNKNGSPAPGIEVDFETTLGSLTTTTATTSSDGVAEVTLKAGKTIGAAIVTADASGFKDQVEVEFVGGPPESITVQAIPSSVPPGGKSSIVGTLRDRIGNPIAGEQLNFSLIQNNSAASLSAPSAVTDVNGQAMVDYTAGDLVRTDKVQVVADRNQTVVSSTWITVDRGSESVGSISLSSGAESIPADGKSSVAITATLFDNSGAPMPRGTSVLFETNRGQFSTSGAKTIAQKTIDDSGTVVVALISSEDAGTATVTAYSGGVSQSINVVFEGEGVVVPTAAFLSLSTSKTSIKTNGTDKATITATVLDENRVSIEGTTVNFSTDGGQISSANVKTDENGQATIDLSSGPDKKNSTVTITATVDEEVASIPINLQGTELTITPASAQVSTGDTQEIVIQALDGDDTPIFDADINVSLDASTTPPADLSFSPSLPDTFQTDLSGKIYLELQAGAIAGNAVIVADAVDSLGASATGTYQIGAAADIFEITAPAEDFSFAIADGSTPVEVTVHAGGLSAGETVEFYTSFGRWAGTGSSTTSETLTTAGQDVTRELIADDPGVATVEVYEQSDLDPSDTVQVSFYNPADKAYDISVEASQANILPSTGDTEYSITITAAVFDENNSPVGDATVYFSLDNTTGGGEYLSQATVTTDPSGIAETTFTSGSKGTGSESDDAVLVTATVATPAHPTDTTRSDDVPIVIREDAANISIGFATQIESNEDNTQYLLPVSVLVADTNGNPVVGKQVSLGLRPSLFRTGEWIKSGDEWVVSYENPCDGSDLFIFVNEDLNGNSFLDDDPPLSEDQTDGYNVGDSDLPAYFDGYSAGDQVPGLNNGMLTPGQSSAGSIPSNVETDENGVASFTLRYQKEYAVWIQAQITATATVFGTENTTKSRKWLPIATDEKEDIANAFPESPFNVLPCAEVTP